MGASFEQSLHQCFLLWQLSLDEGFKRYFFHNFRPTSCEGYNVFDPSISQSVSQSVSPDFLVSAKFVVMKDIMCRCAYPQEILIQCFFLVLRPFELRNLTKMKDTTVLKTACQRNSSETAHQNFVKFFSYEGYNVYGRYAFLLVTNAWNCHSLYTEFSSNVEAWGMWACSLFLSFILVPFLNW